MKKIIKDSGILLIFLLVFLFKENIYNLLIKTSNIEKIDQTIVETKSNYYEKEYKELINSLDLSIIDKYQYQYSKIIYRDIYEFYNEITILKGKNSNIHKKSAVINENGLIGTITKVNKNSSVVSLITNKDSNISIKVNESYGILKYSNNSLIITSINNYENITVGSVIYTSGLGKLPEGIKIGKVESITTNNLGIEKQITVSPFADFDKINYVAILNGDIKWQ